MSDCEFCLSNFTSLYEYFGGISVAFVGFERIRNYFSNRFLNFSEYTQERIEVLRIRSYKASTIANKFLESTSKEGRNESSTIRLSESIIAQLLELDRQINSFFDVNGLREKTDEDTLSKTLFVNGSIVSFIFVFFMLLGAGLEGTFADLIYFFLTLFFAFGLLLLIIYPWVTFNKKLKKFFICKSRFQVVLRMAVVSLLLLFLSWLLLKFNYSFALPIKIIIPLTFIVCSSSVLILTYRYLYYLRIKKLRINKRLTKYENKLYVLRNHMRFDFEE